MNNLEGFQKIVYRKYPGNCAGRALWTHSVPEGSHVVDESPAKFQIRDLECKCGETIWSDWLALGVTENTPKGFVNKPWNPISSHKISLRVTDYDCFL